MELKIYKPLGAKPYCSRPMKQSRGEDQELLPTQLRDQFRSAHWGTPIVRAEEAGQCQLNVALGSGRQRQQQIPRALWAPNIERQGTSPLAGQCRREGAVFRTNMGHPGNSRNWWGWTQGGRRTCLSRWGQNLKNAMLIATFPWKPQMFEAWQTQVTNTRCSQQFKEKDMKPIQGSIWLMLCLPQLT